jgi:hypothetical protein
VGISRKIRFTGAEGNPGGVATLSFYPQLLEHQWISSIPLGLQRFKNNMGVKENFSHP